MVPVELLVLEEDVGNGGEDHQRDALLDDLELDKVERTAIVDKTYAIGRNLTAVLKEGNRPRERYHEIQRPVGRDTRLLQAQMAVPGECHKHIAQDEQQNSIYTVCHIDLECF